MTPAFDREDAGARFVRWLDARLLAEGRGDDVSELDKQPSGSFWLGTLAPEEDVMNRGMGQRGERLDPCAVGIRMQPATRGPWTAQVEIHMRVWLHQGKDTSPAWVKSGPVEVAAHIPIPAGQGSHIFGRAQISAALSSVGAGELSAEVRVDVEESLTGTIELVATLVNTSPQTPPSLKDPTLYEVGMRVSQIALEPFLLDALPDSFRYDRRIKAFGINCGIRASDTRLETTDTVVVERTRPGYILGAPELDCRFASLAEDPISSLDSLTERYAAWGAEAWSFTSLEERRNLEQWTPAMAAEAATARETYEAELTRLRAGVDLLRSDEQLRRAFCLMNEAMAHAARARYDAWRPFQLAFVVSQVRDLVDPDSTAIVDVLWFATGGGKTETHLGLLVTGALYDRLRGKTTGVSAWSRFPLRMLSLQQTQRFADALAGAELARRRANIAGDPFSLGFFVGDSSTPNAVTLDPPEGGPSPDDPGMPSRFQVLLRCPFCHNESLVMGFDRRRWRLEHRCENEACPWPDAALPFFIVDQEIYRFLPTVIVGTLDKAALIALQAAMRGFVGPPAGVCSADGHGYTYAKRQKTPTGCLVAGCTRPAKPVSMASDLWAPTFRLQDELHLLRDTLGAVDSHYESLLDHLSTATSGRRAKIVASSATLTGFERQSETLYSRIGRVFPCLGPTAAESFWSRPTDEMARRFVAVAPRGATLEFVTDRTLTILQVEVRRLLTEPEVVCAEAGVPVASVPFLLDTYGTDVVYGNTLRDLEAVVRSMETQVPVEPLHTVQLTGNTPFPDVRAGLRRLEHREESFDDRIHIVAASAMMSHGVDIDRLNVMVMMGVPLTTAEFIQTTARIGRRYPGLVVVMHKIGRERDAATFRSFGPFVEQGDRFVEPIPVTRRSRKVLQRTMAGILLARILAIHEASHGAPLTTVKALREFETAGGFTEAGEVAAMTEALAFLDPAEDLLRTDLAAWVRLVFEALNDIGGSARFPNELSPTGPAMRSLRDVEKSAPIQQVRP